KKIRQQFPHFQNFTPSCLGSSYNKKIGILTVEMIDGNNPNHIDPKSLLDIHTAISSINYDTALKLCSRNSFQHYIEQYFIWWIFKRLSIVRIFPRIHLRSTNKMIFRRLRKQYGYSNEIRNLIFKLENL